MAAAYAVKSRTLSLTYKYLEPNYIMDSLVWKFISVALSSIPLYFALHLLGSKKAGFVKVVLVNILAAAIVSSIQASFGWFAGALSFIAVLFVYKEMFELGWLTAFIAWLLEIIIVGAIIGGMILLGIAILL